MTLSVALVSIQPVVHRSQYSYYVRVGPVEESCASWFRSTKGKVLFKGLRIAWNLNLPQLTMLLALSLLVCLTDQFLKILMCVCVCVCGITNFLRSKRLVAVKG